MPKIRRMGYSFSPSPERLQAADASWTPKWWNGVSPTWDDPDCGLWYAGSSQLWLLSIRQPAVWYEVKRERKVTFLRLTNPDEKKKQTKKTQPTTRQAFKHANLVFSTLPCLSLCVITAKTVLPREYLGELRIADFLEKCFCLFWFCIFKLL